MHHDTIIVLDFGSQYNQLIVRKIRELNIYAELLPHDTSWQEIEKKNPKGIILSGSPSFVDQENSPRCAEEVFTSSIPVLGICYGMQLMAHTLKGKITPGTKREYGKAELIINEHGSEILFNDLPRFFQVWMSHGDQVGETPPNFITLAHTDNCPIASMAGKIESDEYNKIAIQFHPEVTHTTHGKEILKNFALNICHAEQNWTTGHFIDETTEAIRKTVGTEQVLCAVSGGVDSSVVAALVHKAIGSQLHCFFVDNGLLRKNEVEQVKKSFGSLNIPLHVISAEQRFLTKLAGVIDPEKKRKIIGNEFVAIFEEEAKSIPNVTFLSQGTLYPDVIESKTSASKAGDKIKTHHNVGGLPENMKLKLLEPLRTLFKDEVRALGRKLGLAAELVDRHPFPGPGLAVRVLGDITKDKLDILREADAILIDELRKNNLYHSIWQAFAVLTPLQSVGVMGDERTYQNLLALRMITSEDGMTAEWAKVPFEILETISSRIVNEVRGINRVVYDITTKPPATIEWE